MSHLFRFIAQQETGDSPTWVITGDEHRHLKSVLKLKTGDECEVTDGKGHWAKARIESIGSSQSLASVQQVQTETQITPAVSIAVGALKPGSVDEILPMLVELGVDEVIVFLQTGVAKSRMTDKVQQRWERIILGAIKQCKRAWAPTIRCEENLDAALSKLDESTCLLHMCPDAEQNAGAFLSDQEKPARICGIVGGEKGLDDGEVNLLDDRGAHRVALGCHILRAMTASVALAALLADYRTTTR